MSWKACRAFSTTSMCSTGISEAMDVINYKYHDLKHHIIALRAEENPEKRNQYLDQLENELQDYESQNKTGNKIVDVMLTTKSFTARSTASL